MKRNLVIIAVAVVVMGCAYWGWRTVKRQKNLQTRIGVRQIDPAAAAKPMIAAEEWPKWRGPRGDGISREPLPDSIPSSGLKAVWSADVGIGYSSPIAHSGRVYLFTLNNSKEALTCFDARNGTVIWSDERQTGWDVDYPGTRSTPAIDGDAIYTYGGKGDLICRDLATGHPRWELNVPDACDASNLQWGVASSPFIDAAKVYVQAGQGASVAAAVDKSDGRIVWKSEARGTSGYSAVTSADVEGTTQLIVFAGDAVIGMNPADGRTIWQQGWKTNYAVNATTPVYHEGHLFVTSEYGMGGLMLKLSPAGAQRVWAKKDVQSKFQQVIVDNGVLYAATDRRLKCLSWPDGAVKWKTPAGEPPVGDNGSIVRAGDKLVVLSDQGMLTLVKATPNGAEVRGQFQAAEGDKIWSTPLLYGGRVYVKGPKELICYDLGLSTPPAGPATAPVATVRSGDW
jgi:outer membrane protein assembly factor BamB